MGSRQSLRSGEAAMAATPFSSIFQTCTVETDGKSGLVAKYLAADATVSASAALPGDEPLRVLVADDVVSVASSAAAIGSALARYHSLGDAWTLTLRPDGSFEAELHERCLSGTPIHKASFVAMVVDPAA